MNNTTMITIDSSTKKTGIAVFVNGIYIEHHLIDHSKNLKMENRYPLMCIDLYNILETYKPEIIYIEDEVVSRNMNTCRFLFRLQGMIEGWCILNGAEFNTVRPTVWRSSLNFNQGRKFNRTDLKIQSIKFIKGVLNLNVTDDEADAICIGYYALNRFNIDWKPQKGV